MLLLVSKFKNINYQNSYHYHYQIPQVTLSQDQLVLPLVEQLEDFYYYYYYCFTIGISFISYQTLKT